ncbi:FAD-dependent oxidoreductase [Candidatus Woesearchaeota archaeon]|nr:FAD-dependent oxidoreductase [Candidatus Woesearchaeota archaeon]
MSKAVVLGAGITGLFAAYKLVEAGWDVTVLERNDHVGGIAASFRKDGITYDYGPHKIYTQLPGVLDEYRHLLGDDMLAVKKRNALYLFDRFLDFPPKITQLVKGIPFGAGVRSGVSYAVSLAKSLVNRQQAVSYEDYFLNGFGSYGYNLLFRDYAWKVWGDPCQLSEELARKRMPIPSIPALLKNIVAKQQNPDVSADVFYYPKHGFGQLSEKLASLIKTRKGKLLLKTTVTKIIVKKGMVAGVKYSINGREQSLLADRVISTLHITDLPGLFGNQLPPEAGAAAKELKHRGLILAYFVFEKDRMMPYNWAFFPEKRFIFNRVSELKSFSTHTMPHDKTVIIAEVTTTPGSDLWVMDEKQFLHKVLDDLQAVGLYHGERLLESFTKRAGRVYPIYSITYRQHLETLLGALDAIGHFVTVGRQGLFNYNNTDHCIDMANRAVSYIVHDEPIAKWQEARRYFDTYRIVD